MAGLSRRAGAVLAALLLGAGVQASPASAQGEPIGGAGNDYYFGGPFNDGLHDSGYRFGDPGDQVYIGDVVSYDGLRGDGFEDLIVRRGNTFIINGAESAPFVYGDPGDTVLVGDWDGDGTDTLAVRRGNHFFIRNSVTTGVADHDFYYGDPGDTVLVGNWDGFHASGRAAKTDTLAVRRGNRYFIKNSAVSGIADYDVVFGDPGDQVLVGDWGTPPAYGDDPATAVVETSALIGNPRGGDRSDEFAVRRGNVYFMSAQLSGAGPYSMTPTARTVVWGSPADTAFVVRQRGLYYGTNPCCWTDYTADSIGLRR